MKKALLILAVTLILMGCDPVHTINFRNKVSGNSKVKIILYPDTDVYEFGRLATGDSIVFLLEPEAEESINFGVGTWSDESIDHLVGEIKSLEIEAGKNVIVYDTKERVKALFTESRKGFRGWEAQIQIDINNK